MAWESLTLAGRLRFAGWQGTMFMRLICQDMAVQKGMGSSRFPRMSRLWQIGWIPKNCTAGSSSVILWVGRLHWKCAACTLKKFQGWRSLHRARNSFSLINLLKTPQTQPPSLRQSKNCGGCIFQPRPRPACKPSPGGDSLRFGQASFMPICWRAPIST